MSGKLKDLTGNVYTRLTVVSFSHMNGKHSYWNCVCECGNTKKVRSDCLKYGLVKSCGCLNNEPKVIKHGHYGEKLYHVWGSLRHRCNNPNDKNYKYYGGRSITVCDEWADYMNFHNWAMANGYQNGLTIDRINNDGNYESSNCRWVTMTVQNRNKRQRGKSNGKV